MEGYTNVIGNQYDFDDLDIEGRVVDEWNQDEEKKISRLPVLKWDEKAIVNERVKLDNGKQANVFSVVKKNDSTLYICHICTDTLVGVTNLRQHGQSSKHRSNMSKPVHPRAKFVKIDPKENLSLEPGEPVPPGLEEMIIKNCAIQPNLDDYKSPLIGLEFVVELTQPNTYDEEYYYYCLLCEKTGSERNMLIHLTSIYHNLKYLSMYFPSVAKKLHVLSNKKRKKAFYLVIKDIVGDIEAKYGRLKPFAEPRADFDSPGRMAELQKMVNAGPHLREKEGELFDEKATEEYFNIKSAECLNAPPVTGKAEETEKNDDKKETTGSLFNKLNRTNFDKKQLRPREDEARNSSPDVEIVNIQLPKSAPKVSVTEDRRKRTRSRSLSSVSSNSSSRSRSRYYRQYSRPYHRSRSRSPRRSRSPQSRYRRISPYSRHHSPRHRSRDRSPYRKRRYHSPDNRSRERLDRYGRSRDMYDSRNDKYRREKNSRERTSREMSREKYSPVKTAEEKLRWESFREELKAIENVKLDKLKYYEKNPEQHPQYPNEWKGFWNQRYSELQKSGIDPSKHDFKPEWISFWTKRMKELYEEDLNQSKNDLRKKFDLPDDVQCDFSWKSKSRRHNNSSPGLVDVSPPTPDKKDVIAGIKSTWKALTGSDIKDAPKRPLSPWEDDRSPTMKREQRSPSPSIFNEKLLENMPQRKSRTSSLIFILRKLTVLEQQLGYLAPKVFELLQQALALEKIKQDASLDLLHETENAFYLETVREKLIGLLCAGIVPRNMVNTARSAMKHIDIALYLVSMRERTLPNTSLSMRSGIPVPMSMQYVEPPKSEPVVVPGIGQVDKAAIAQQIANALIEQGKTNVTEAELGQLINAVVGMAEASANSAQSMTTASFLEQLQNAQNFTSQSTIPVNMPAAEATLPVLQPTPQMTNETSDPVTVAPSNKSAFGGALKLLQSAYDESCKPEQDSPKPEIADIGTSKPVSPISDVELAANLAMFNNTPKEEQSTFIQQLKTSNIEMYKRLCPFIPVSSLISPDNSKRSPINISLSKAKSEQKIKPIINSGRLSPFSSRTGGANPAVGEAVIDIDEEVKVINETSSTPPRLNANKEISSFQTSKINLDDDEDDDDDDDYSFEDVYKAAQERLRQKQENEDQIIKKSTPIIIDEFTRNEQLNKDEIIKKSTPIIDEFTRNDKLKEDVATNPDKPHVTVTDKLPWSMDSQGNSSFYMQENFQKQRPTQNEQNQSTQFSSQPLKEYDTFREIQPSVTQSVPYQSLSTSTQNYQETMERKPTLSQNYSNREDYQFDSAYSFRNDDVYDKSNQYSTESYYSRTGSYFNQSKDIYPNSYDGPYSNQTNAGYMNEETTSTYGNSMGSYGGDPYKYRQQRPVSIADNRAPWRPNHPAPPQRFPNSNYPPY